MGMDVELVVSEHVDIKQNATFVMAVAYGASASFLTPYGYTTNLMVQNLGSYQMRDYVRAGLPLSLIYSAIVILLVPRVFPF